MENAITFTAKQEDGITGKCYNQKLIKSNTVKKVDVRVKCWFDICLAEPDSPTHNRCMMSVSIIISST
jgi:hypothetical protein